MKETQRHGGPEKPSILFVVRPTATGIQRHLVALIDGLTADGYTVAVAGPQELPFLNACRQGAPSFFALPVPDQPNASRILSASRLLHRIVERTQPDILHAEGLAALLVVAANRALGDRRPTVATVHNLPVFELSSGLRGGLSRYMLRQACGRIDRVVVVSKALETYFRPFTGRTRLRLIYNGLDLDTYPPMPEVKGERGVGFMGRLTPEKGADLFVEVAERLMVTYGYKGPFLLAGEGPMRPLVERRVSALALPDCIHMLGFVSEVERFFAQTEVLVVPSRSREGFPLTVLEAGYYRRPVVAFAVDGLNESVVDGVTGVLVPANDTDALAQAVLRLLRAPQEAQRMGEAAHQRVVESFTAQRMVQAFETLYAECPASGQARVPLL